ncbi:hypothetical protein NLG97_g5099 [Lecanicillium saksenae]|uniref:Uncharacterized protein n=1 Tax=Lecanicillium saksenae TaxID=468837 RepID=A0ACC1QUK4_9HYPO|nr:hypothetical protein NLG97_g5099 [Lecanicillium saksenae]
MSASTVPANVLSAFGVTRNAPLKPLPGGSLVCFLAGDDVVFRPSEDDSESEQIAQILVKLRSIMTVEAEYRVSRPIPVVGCPERFVFGGWTAWSFVSGCGRDEISWHDTLHVCRAIHVDLGNVEIEKPEFLDRRLNRFRLADQLAWGEASLADMPNVTNPVVLSRINGPMKRLVQFRYPLDHLPNQLIHGDICGNMLFDSEGKPPGVIDMTFYWRPQAYGAAIAVADGLLWNKEGENLIELYGTDTDSIQLLVRALLFRTATWVIDVPIVSRASDEAWAKTMLPLVDFDGAIDVINKYLAQN